MVRQRAIPSLPTHPENAALVTHLGSRANNGEFQLWTIRVDNAEARGVNLRVSSITFRLGVTGDVDLQSIEAITERVSDCATKI